MNEKELMQTALRYQMSMGFLNGLLNDGKLKKAEFDVAAKYVANRYDIEAVEYELAKLRYPNLQTKEPVLCKAVVEKAEAPYISLTDIAKKFSDEAPSYVIQSWMRSRSTLEFLKLWEQRHNDRFNVDGYEMLMDKFNSGAFTMTPKQWVAYTGAIGISTKPGKNGGTHAHRLLADAFMMWLDPKYKLDFLEMRVSNQLTKLD